MVDASQDFDLPLHAFEVLVFKHLGFVKNLDCHGNLRVDVDGSPDLAEVSFPYCFVDLVSGGTFFCLFLVVESFEASQTLLNTFHDR